MFKHSTVSACQVLVVARSWWRHGSLAIFLNNYEPQRHGFLRGGTALSMESLSNWLVLATARCYKPT